MTANALASLSQALVNGTIKVIDLSHPLSAKTPILHLPPPYANTPPVEEFTISYFDEDGPYWTWKYYTLGEHTGTHFDAPGHWISGRHYANGTTDTIEPERFIAPACVIDCSEASAGNAGFVLTAGHIKEFERTHGSIKDAWVLMRTDWYKKAGDANAFLNPTEAGPFTPGPSVDAVQYMIAAGAVGFGVETVGTDAGQAFLFDPPYPAHTLMHGANRFGMASLANLDKLPPTGALIITPPLKFEAGSGSPVRVLALVSSQA